MKDSSGSPGVGIQWVVIQHVLLEKENYIIHNLQWSDDLQHSLIQEGLLPTNGEEKVSTEEMCVFSLKFSLHYPRGDKMSMLNPYIPTQTLRKSKWLYAVDRLTAHFTYVLMSYLVILQSYKNNMVIQASTTIVNFQVLLVFHFHMYKIWGCATIL